MKGRQNNQIKQTKMHTSCQCTGQQANCPAVRKIFPALSDDVEEKFFLTTKFSVKSFTFLSACEYKLPFCSKH